MKYLPVGLDVRGRICIVVGAGNVGARKVTNLLGAGAAVTVVSPDAPPDIARLAAEGHLIWKKRSFQAQDLEEAFLVVAATDDQEVNAELVHLSADQGALVCDASSADRSEVIFGAIHQTAGTTVAVFTDGRSPSRARRTRDRIASLQREWEEEQEETE